MFIKLQQNINKFYIFLYFFLIPSSYSNYLTAAFFAVSFFLLLGELLLEKNSFFDKKVLLLFIAFAFALFVSLVLSPYSLVNAISSFVFLSLSFFAYYKNNGISSFSKKGIDWFYWSVLLSIVLHLIVALSTEGFGLARFFISGGAWDVNVGSLVLFAFYSYCDAKHYKSWFPVAVLTVFFGRESRGCLVVFGLFILIKLIKLFVSKTKLNKKANSRNITYEPIIVIGLAVVAVVCFSYFWTFVVSSSNVLYYHEGLNDGSNAVRFRSNIYALEQVFGTTDFMFFGYDNDIRLLLGDISPEESAMFLGYRLVQSHNSIINLFMKNGILFSCIYIVLLCVLLKKSFDIKRIEHWLPYLFGSMILHSMFSNGFLLIFLISLCATPIKNNNPRSYRSIGRDFYSSTLVFWKD